MHLNRPSINQLVFSKNVGFSLVEVLIAFSILIIVLASVFELRLSSLRRMEQTAERNQVQNAIRQDMAFVRKQALKWKCREGTACTGEIADQNTPPRYESDHCATTNPYGDFSITSKILDIDNDKIEVKRKVIIDGEKLKITYIGTYGDQSITTHTTIIPQAMNWC